MDRPDSIRSCGATLASHANQFGCDLCVVTRRPADSNQTPRGWSSERGECRNKKKTLATTDVATTSLNVVPRFFVRRNQSSFSRESNPGTVEFAARTPGMLFMKCQTRAGLKSTPGRWWQKGAKWAARENVRGRARASARVQATATRRQQNRHSKRCKKRETGQIARPDGNSEADGSPRPGERKLQRR